MHFSPLTISLGHDGIRECVFSLLNQEAIPVFPPIEDMIMVPTFRLDSVTATWLLCSLLHCILFTQRYSNSMLTTRHTGRPETRCPRTSSSYQPHLTKPAVLRSPLLNHTRPCTMLSRHTRTQNILRNRPKRIELALSRPGLDLSLAFCRASRRDWWLGCAQMAGLGWSGEEQGPWRSDWCGAVRAGA
jgi:hypothetical protein